MQRDIRDSVVTGDGIFTHVRMYLWYFYQLVYNHYADPSRFPILSADPKTGLVFYGVSLTSSVLGTNPVLGVGQIEASHLGLHTRTCFIYRWLRYGGTALTSSRYALSPRNNSPTHMNVSAID